MTWLGAGSPTAGLKHPVHRAFLRQVGRHGKNAYTLDFVKSAKDGWVLKTSGRIVGWFATKAAALEPGSLLQRILDSVSGGEGTVRIHTEIGGIEEERTYLRSRGLRKSRG